MIKNENEILEKLEILQETIEDSYDLSDFDNADLTFEIYPSTKTEKCIQVTIELITLEILLSLIQIQKHFDCDMCISPSFREKKHYLIINFSDK